MKPATLTAGAQDSTEAAPTPTRPWLLRHPLTAAAMALVGLQVLIRTTILGDAYFVTDDFMLTTRALESDLGWDYLTRVHTGHFEPIPFMLYWLLAHGAPLSWAPVVALAVVGQLVLNIAIWRLLRLLFGARPLILVPYAIFLFAALTLPSFLWFAAAVITLPLQISLTLALYWHVKYTRERRVKYAFVATAALIFGLLCFEKALLFVPFAYVFTASYWPAARSWVAGFIQATRRLWPVWAMYASVVAGYLAVYLIRARDADATSRLFLPSVGELWKFTYFSIFQTFIPGVFGGPWRWWSTGNAGALSTSPRVLEWLTWTLALALVLTTCTLRRRAGRAWAMLLIYLLGSIAAIGFTRVPLIGAVLGLETRYVADALVPFTVAFGLSIMPLIGERDPWVLPDLMNGWVRRRRIVLGAAAGMATALLVLSSLVASYRYADIVTANPSRQFVLNVRTDLAKLPKDAQVYDHGLDNPIVGAFFGDYKRSSRFLAPFVDEQARRGMYARKTYTKPYLIANDGHLRPMTVSGAVSAPGPAGDCGWQIDQAGGGIPLNTEVFDWHWAIRIGYLASADTTAYVSFGDATSQVRLRRGLNQIVFPVVAGGDTVRISGLADGVTMCVGDVQVGTPVAAP